MKKAINISGNSAPAFPYSPAIEANGFVFLSGQIPTDSSGSVIEGGIKEQTSQCLRNAEALLAAAGADRSAVVKTTIFIKDMNAFSEVNEIYKKFFEGTVLPARTTVEISRLPKDVLIEIEMIALKKGK